MTQRSSRPKTGRQVGANGSARAAKNFNTRKKSTFEAVFASYKQHRGPEGCATRRLQLADRHASDVSDGPRPLRPLRGARHVTATDGGVLHATDGGALHERLHRISRRLANEPFEAQLSVISVGIRVPDPRELSRTKVRLSARVQASFACCRVDLSIAEFAPPRRRSN